MEQGETVEVAASGPMRKVLMECTAQIVAAHVSTKPTDPQNLPAMIKMVYDALGAAHKSGTGETAAAPAEKPTPAVPVKKSVFPDFIVCLEDGKKLKMLKRHLQSAYSLTPDQYRARWSLPPDYPMVAPNYAQRRSDLARKIGLGRGKSGGGASVVVDAIPHPAIEPAVAKQRGRRRATA